MTFPPHFRAVDPALVGDNAPSVRPGDDPALYGDATLWPLEPVEVRSFRTFEVRYRVGRLGLDDTGAIRVTFREVSDVGPLQTEDPAAPGYVTARTSGPGRILTRVGSDGHRPWNTHVTAELRGGCLCEGDEISITFGDTSQGSPGWAMQTFAEGGFDFRVMTDVQATGNFLPLARQLAVPVVAGPAARWVAVLPTLVRAGDSFRLGLKAEDRWGNPTGLARARLKLEANLAVAGLPEWIDYAPDDRAMTLEGLSCAEPGVLRIRVLIDETEVAEAGPLVVREDGPISFWGDLHGQTGETVGINTIESYFDFARNKAFLDVSSHQGNDFQMNAAFWQRLNEVTAEWNEPGRFTVFPGYEWSGNTAVGGDHNVFFAEEGRAIRRCSHALVEDRSDLESDANTLTELYAALADENCVLCAHVGGRYADVAYDHDPRLETAVEMHSAWGSFEWILTDSLALGRRVGVVCNSDGHKGRPGASYPGDSHFGAYGGLTCFVADQNDRAGIMAAQRARHHYGTTGCRMHLEVTADLPEHSEVWDRNPVIAEATGAAATRAVMGDIVSAGGDSLDLSVRVVAHAGIERVELRHGARIVETVRPYGAEDLGQRLRVVWSGAEYRGRGRESEWRGQARLTTGRIVRFEPINLWNPERLLEQRGSDAVVFDTVTTGNFMGFDIWVEAEPGARLIVTTNRGVMSVDLDRIGVEPRVMDAGGLSRQLCVSRLPDARLEREMAFDRTVQLTDGQDDALWVAVTTEDGFQAWSSPIYVI